MKRRNPFFGRPRCTLHFRPRGTKLVSEEDVSPVSSSPKNASSFAPPPSPTPDLGQSAPPAPPPKLVGKQPRPKGPPAPDDPYWLESRRRRLPSYFYRRLPDWFYLPDDPSPVGVVAAGTSKAARVEDCNPSSGAVAQIDEEPEFDNHWED